VTFDPEAIRRLGGPRRIARPAASLAYLVRVGAGAGLAAALCNVALLLVSRAAGWDTSVDATALQPLPVVVVSLSTGVLAGLGAYAAARVTKRPDVWTCGAGALLYAASLPGLPAAVLAMHTITALWVVGWLAVAVRGGTHLR
jgi:hypothetical protein